MWKKKQSAVEKGLAVALAEIGRIRDHLVDESRANFDQIRAATVMLIETLKHESAKLFEAHGNEIGRFSKRLLDIEQRLDLLEQEQPKRK